MSESEGESGTAGASGGQPHVDPATWEETPDQLLTRLEGSVFWRPVALLLEKDALAAALELPWEHKRHALAYLLTRGTRMEADGHAATVLSNLVAALKIAQSDSALEGWMRARLNDAARESNMANASSQLAELRAAGDLALAGFLVKPVPPRASPTPDLCASADEVDLFVEVHCKQMNAEQAAELKEPAPDGARVVHPAGRPKEGETTAENVASKFASIKPRAHQASSTEATVLWLDVQDQDWWPVDASHAAPATASKQQFYSGGLWHAIYGRRGTPLFEHHSWEERASEGVGTMRHDGVFGQHPEWSAAILTTPRSTIVFQNPNAAAELGMATLRRLTHLPRFDLNASRVDWPPGSRSAADAVDADRALLRGLASEVRYSW